MNHVGLVDHDRSFAILKRVRPSRLKKDGTTYIYRHVYICTYAYATRVSLLLLYPSVFQLLAPLLSCGYVCIIATNISHRPTFRSTTQHNHCRIIMVFLVFFSFFFPLTRPMRFPHRLILQYQVLNHIIVFLYIY